MDASVEPLFKAYVQAPSAEGYARLREAVIQRPGYDPYGVHFFRARELLDKGDAAAAADYLKEHLDDLLLNPGTYLLLAVALGRTGRQEEARAFGAMAGLLVRPILDSGDGTRERPYVVNYIADEYDVLRSLGKEVRMQALKQGEGAVYDYFSCQDATELWFDITTPFGQIHKGLGVLAQEAPAPRPRRWWQRKGSEA